MTYRKLKRSECAILPLVLKRKWYDMIDRGEKREEYRDFKPYWETRIENWKRKQSYGWDLMEYNKRLVIGFSLGYEKPDMFFLLHHEEIKYRPWHPEWGEPRGLHYVLELGDRVEFVDERKRGAK